MLDVRLVKRKKRISQLQNQITSYKTNLKKQKEVLKKLETKIQNNQVVLWTQI